VIVHLVRHGTHDDLGRKLTGRMPAALNDVGRQQSRRLADYFAARGIDLLQTSPRERTIETAHPIGQTSELACDVVPALDELDFGAWSGVDFASLQGDPRWISWNCQRSRCRPPGGETMNEASQRVLDHIDALRPTFHGARVVLVTHAEIIRSVLLRLLGRSMDAWDTIEIAPASISSIAVRKHRLKVAAINKKLGQ
jgi:ribonuclease H / adenosylcobalamin/alpha-ribazole phosphatase